MKKQNKDWEKEFDKKFLIPKGYFQNPDMANCEGTLWTNPEIQSGKKIKDFIRQLLAQKEEEVKENSDL